METMGFLQENEQKTTKQTTSIIVPETFTHAIAFGETGSGKTSSFIYPNLLQRLKHLNYLKSLLKRLTTLLRKLKS